MRNLILMGAVTTALLFSSASFAVAMQAKSKMSAKSNSIQLQAANYNPCYANECEPVPQPPFPYNKPSNGQPNGGHFEPGSNPPPPIYLEAAKK